MNIEELRLRLQEANDGATQLRVKVEAEKRDLSSEEEAELDGYLDLAERTELNIARYEKLEGQTERLNAAAGRRTAPEQPKAPIEEEENAPAPRRQSLAQRSQVTVTERVDPRTRKTGGFESLGHMAYFVRLACINGGHMDPRLQRLATASTYGNEGVGADGGFAVPPDFREAIMETIQEEGQLLPLTDQITVNGNTFTCPIDETSPWQTSGGIQAAWEGEASAAAQSKVLLKERMVKLNKLRAFVPMTEELLEDASAMDSYLRRKAPAKIAAKINTAILAGNGVGMPLGVLNSTALITVAEESGQVAATLVGNNILKMWSRMYGPCRQKAVWVINQAVEPQLYKLSLPGTDNTGNAVTGWGTMLYIPPGGINNANFGMLLGRPVLTNQAASDLDTPGDIGLYDFSQYLSILKSGPNPKVETSIHLWFDQDIVAFKFILRMGGVPWWSLPVSALNGSNTYSPFVCLATRT